MLAVEPLQAVDFSSVAKPKLPDIVNHGVPPGLRIYVERAVTVSYAGSIGAEWQVLPSGCFGLRAILDDGYATHDNLGNLVVSGVVPRSFNARCLRANAVIAVALTPLAAATLPLSAHRLDTMADAAGVEVLGSHRFASLYRRLAGTASLEGKVQLYLAWLEQVFQTLRPAHGRRLALAEVMSQIQAGQVRRVQDAADRVGVSRRQLERDFQHHVGLSPQQLGQVATFQRFAQLAWQGEKLAHIAADLELVDQAHLTRVIKAMSGLTPAALLKKAATSPLSRLTRPHWGGRITYL